MTSDLTQKDILLPCPILVCTTMSEPERFNMLLEHNDCLILVSNRYHRQLTQSLTKEFPHLGLISPDGDNGLEKRFHYTEGPVSFHVDNGKVIFHESILPPEEQDPTDDTNQEPNID